jgi:hypothetical protein
MLTYTTEKPTGKWSGANKGLPEIPAIGTRVIKEMFPLHPACAGALATRVHSQTHQKARERCQLPRG